MDPFFIGLPMYVATQFGVTPLINFAAQKIRAQIDPVEIGPEEFPAQVAVYFEAQASALEQIGFHRVAYVKVPESVSGKGVRVYNYSILMLNRERGDGAMINAIMKVVSGVESVATQFVEFSSRYPDGRTFDTLNSSSLSGFARVAGETKTRVPSVTDPRQLYALHRYVISKANVTGRPIIFDPSKVADFFKAERTGSLTAQVRCGRYYLNKAGDTFRPTLKGAYLMTWSLMWPISIFRRKAMERRASKILREFYAVYSPAAPALAA